MRLPLLGSTVPSGLNINDKEPDSFNSLSAEAVTVMDNLWSAMGSVFRGPHHAAPTTPAYKESISSKFLSPNSTPFPPPPASDTSQLRSLLDRTSSRPTTPKPYSIDILDARQYPLALPIDPDDSVTCLNVHGTHIFVGTSSGSILQWNIATNTYSRTFELPNPDAPSVVCLASSTRRLFAGYSDGSIRSFSLSSGACVRSISSAHNGPVTTLCYTSEGRLYSGGEDGPINEWDARSLRRKWILPGHQGRVDGICAMAGKVYSCGKDCKIMVWDMANGRCLSTYDEHQEHILSMSLGRDLLYTGSQDGVVQVLDIGSGQCLRTLKGHEGQPVRAVCLARGKLYSAGDDGSVCEWDVKKGKVLRKFEGGNVVGMSGASGGKVIIAHGDIVKLLEIGSGSDNASGSACTSPTASVVASAPPSPPLSPTPSYIPQNHFADLRPVDSISNRPDGTESVMSHPTAETTDDVQALRNQLARLQTILTRQTLTTSRLKQDLLATRSELSALKSEQSAAVEYKSRAEEAEEELVAAKELLVTYKAELDLTQEAHSHAFAYLQQSSNRSWVEIEKEISGLKEMVQESASFLFSHDELGAFLPARKVGRCWDKDDEWDSDVEVEEGTEWWRKNTRFSGGPTLGDIKDPGAIKWWRDDSADVMPSAHASPEDSMEEDDDIIVKAVVVKGARRLSDGGVMTIADSPTSATPASSPPPVPRSAVLPPSSAIAAAKMFSSVGSSEENHPDATHDARRQRPTPRRSNSWFKPIQNWVETLGEVIVPIGPGETPPAPHLRPHSSAVSVASDGSFGESVGRKNVVRVRRADVWRFDEGEQGKQAQPGGMVATMITEDLESIVRESAAVPRPSKGAGKRLVVGTGGSPSISGPDSAVDVRVPSYPIRLGQKHIHEPRGAVNHNGSHSALEKVANAFENVFEGVVGSGGFWGGWGNKEKVHG